MSATVCGGYRWTPLSMWHSSPPGPPGGKRQRWLLTHNPEPRVRLHVVRCLPLRDLIVRALVTGADGFVGTHLVRGFWPRAMTSWRTPRTSPIAMR